MKGDTGREAENKNPKGNAETPPEPTYHVSYDISYDIGPPYTVLVD